LTRAAIAIGADGVIIDVHPHPESALCDGPQALVDGDLRELAKIVRDLPPLVGRTVTRPADLRPAPASAAPTVPA
jgi:3-deoxy-7-phosphoheptulonate synthase